MASLPRPPGQQGVVLSAVWLSWVSVPTWTPEAWARFRLLELHLSHILSLMCLLVVEHHSVIGLLLDTGAFRMVTRSLLVGGQVSGVEL